MQISHNLALFETLENKLQSLTLKTISHKITLVVPNCKMMSAHAHFVNVHLFLTFLLLAPYSLHFSLLLLIHSKASTIEFSVYFYSANEVIQLFLLLVSLSVYTYFYIVQNANATLSKCTERFSTNPFPKILYINNRYFSLFLREPFYLVYNFLRSLLFFLLITREIPTSICFLFNLFLFQILFGIALH